jgi:hypothetical protein
MTEPAAPDLEPMAEPALDLAPEPMTPEQIAAAVAAEAAAQAAAIAADTAAAAAATAGLPAPPALQRLPDWQTRFAALVAARRAVPFAWGSNDCAAFAADAVAALTGQDVAPAELRGEVLGALADSADAAIDARAIRLLRRNGGLAVLASAVLGEQRAPVFATVGDIVLLDNAGREILAVCNGATAFAPGPRGLAVTDMSGAIGCWKVGA